jgi:cell filamentation protein
MFCYPEHISAQMNGLFTELKENRFLRELAPDAFAVAAARFLGTLNAIHPFRDGNGRTQLAFLALLADRADHPLALRRLDPHDFLDAMVSSFKGNDRLLSRQIAILARKD